MNAQTERMFGFTRDELFERADGRFVRDILRDCLDHTAVCCFRDAASVCNVRTNAECVETTDVLNELKRIGIDFAQGYLIHRPEPLDTLLRSLRNQPTG